MTAQCEHNLRALGNRLTAAGEPAEDLVGIYITENPEPDYAGPPQSFGRVIALVRALPMPAGQTVWSFPSGCHEFRRNRIVDRWPVGWPSEAVFYSPTGGPMLRDAFLGALGRNDFWALTHGTLCGPIDLLEPWLQPLERYLLREIRHRVACDPHTQVRPF